MSIVKRSEELESWLDCHSSGWEMQSDRDYKAHCSRWLSAYSGPVERGLSHSNGRKALENFRAQLPCDVLVISGLRIARLGNQGGAFVVAYAADGLAVMDIALGARLELIVVAQDYSWCLPLSHEVGGFCSEEFYVLDCMV